MRKELSLIGVASGVGAASRGCENGPLVCQQSEHLGISPLNWVEILQPKHLPSKLETIAELAQRLARHTFSLVHQRNQFVVIGGDHSCAIGTWSGAAAALRPSGDLGLIWIDAHLDAHTPDTTPSGNIHGMPVASLLGYGSPQLTQILDKNPKLKPQNLCYVGVRDFEVEEQTLIERLGVRVYYMDEVRKRGLHAVLGEALTKITQNTVAFGVSIDIDVMEPSDAPGTGINVADGISAKELVKSLRLFSGHPKFLGMEIAEFDPRRDQNRKTEKLIGELILCLIKRKEQPL